MMRADDAKVYRQLTGAMNDASGGIYKIGTTYEIEGNTISGSELDWAFDQAGVWAVGVNVVGRIGEDKIEDVVAKVND